MVDDFSIQCFAVVVVCDLVVWWLSDYVRGCFAEWVTVGLGGRVIWWIGCQVNSCLGDNMN